MATADELENAREDSNHLGKRPEHGATLCTC